MTNIFHEGFVLQLKGKMKIPCNQEWFVVELRLSKRVYQSWGTMACWLFIVSLGARLENDFKSSISVWSMNGDVLDALGWVEVKDCISVCADMTSLAGKWKGFLVKVVMFLGSWISKDIPTTCVNDLWSRHVESSAGHCDWLSWRSASLTQGLYVGNLLPFV